MRTDYCEMKTKENCSVLSFLTQLDNGDIIETIDQLKYADKNDRFATSLVGEILNILSGILDEGDYDEIVDDLKDNWYECVNM